MNCREIREMSLWWGSVGLRVFNQHSAIHCTRRRGMETSCLHFQLCQWAQVCVLDCGFPSVSSCKYMRGTGSWPRSSPGSGFCGLTEFAVFIVWAVCGKGRDQACLWLLQSLSFFVFPSSCIFCFNLCVHLITYFSALLKYFLHRIHHPL